MRYASLFRELAQFPVPTRDTVISAEVLPAADLPRAASQWLHRLSNDADPLLLSFGLDAVAFFFELVEGRHGYGDGADLNPIVHLQPPMERGHFADTRSLRKLYTERVLRGLTVIARVPDGGAIRFQGREPLIASGQRFGLRIVRCHLSENPPDELTQLKAEWPELRPFDRAWDFAFRSQLLVARDAAGESAPWAPGLVVAGAGPLVDVPAHWITSTFDPYDDPHGQRVAAVRSWAM